jgi:hypothetical protein
VAIGFVSPALLQTQQARVQALGCMVVSSVKIMRFSSFWTAPSEPSTVADAPGDGGFKDWPFVRADTFGFNMNRRGCKTKSKGQEEPDSLA